jgi:hypothetical protein
VSRFPGNQFGDEGVEVLAARLAANSSLRELDLTGCHVTTRGIRALTTCGGLEKLTRLVLDINPIEPETIRLLADTSRLPALRTVSVARSLRAKVSELRAAASGGKLVLSGSAEVY